MTRTTIIALFILSVAVGLELLAGSPEPGTTDLGSDWSPRLYACGKVAGPIVLDGKLDDAAWDGLPWTSEFVDIERSNDTAPRYRTRAKLAWDDQYLYICAEMEEPDLWATFTTRDSIIYHEHDFEVFIDPDHDTHQYAELEINALNTVWDLMLVRPYRDGGPAVHGWDIAGLKTAVHLRGSLNDHRDRDIGWSVEIAIPFEALGELTKKPCPPAPGDRWKINFSRVQWQLDESADGYTKVLDEVTGESLAEDNWVWSPQRAIAMHEPEYWGIVEFRERGDTERVIEVLDVDRARFIMCRHAVAMRSSENHAGESPDRPAALPSAWSWPPVTQSGPGWFHTEIHDESGRRITVDQSGAARVIAPHAGLRPR